MKEKELKAVFAGRMKILVGDKYGNQQEAAKKIGVSNSVVCSWLNGRGLPEAITLVQIADAYGVSADWLLGRENKTQKGMEIQGYKNGLKLASGALFDMHLRFEELLKGVRP